MTAVPACGCDVSRKQLEQAERAFGRPHEQSIVQDLQAWELDLIEGVCGDSRYHDVTAFIMRDHHLAMIHKPSEPPGAYWAPSGGLLLGEPLEHGVRREALEETGLEVEPVRYLLRLNAMFRSGERTRPWTSHVFLARHVAGDPAPIDTKEVDRAAWVSVRCFRDEVAPLLFSTGWGRYRYRLRMAQLIFGELGLEHPLGAIGCDLSGPLDGMRDETAAM